MVTSQGRAEPSSMTGNPDVHSFLHQPRTNISRRPEDRGTYPDEQSGCFEPGYLDPTGDRYLTMESYPVRSVILTGSPQRAG